MILALMIAFQLAAALSPAPTIDIGEEIGSVQVVRCHFAEGRIVIRLNDELHVLHEGDRLETTDLKVVEINADSATMAIRGSEPAGNLRIVRVSISSTGVIRLRELSTDPADLNTGKSAIGAPMAINRDRPPDPSSED